MYTVYSVLFLVFVFLRGKSHRMANEVIANELVGKSCMVCLFHSSLKSARGQLAGCRI